MSERNKVCKTTERPGLRLRLRAWGLGLANILTVKLICSGQPQDVGASTAAPVVNGSKNENGKQGARAYKRRKCTSTPSISQDWFRSWFRREGFGGAVSEASYSNGCLSLLTISMAFPIYILVQSSWLRVTITHPLHRQVPLRNQPGFALQHGSRRRSFIGPGRQDFFPFN